MTQLRLLLKFANYDSGKRDEIEFEDTATVGQLKEHILNEHWPSNGMLASLRLLCAWSTGSPCRSGHR